MRTYKIVKAYNGAYSYFGYDGEPIAANCIQQSRKLWRRKSDCERAAKTWAKGE